MAKTSIFKALDLYVHRQASSWWRYGIEQALLGLFGWIPTIAGIAIRAVVYRFMLKIQGIVAIEKGVRIRFASNIRLANGVFLDEGVYLHACLQGLSIGRNTRVMHGAVLHVYNFRDLPNAGICIGQDCLIGEYTVIRGQGGVEIGDRVYTSPQSQLIAVDHVFDDPARSFIDQGITAKGIVIEDDVWIGSGAIITDGVRIGQGAVIAAGAVVTKDVAPHYIAAGVPARVLRRISADDQLQRDEPIYMRIQEDRV